MVATTLDNPRAASIDAELDAYARAAQATFITLASRSARGESLTPEEIRTACVAAGIPVAKFGPVVKTIRQRLDALAVIANADKRREPIDALCRAAEEVRRKIEALDADYQKQRAELVRQHLSAHTEYQVAASAENDAQGQAHRTLRVTAADPLGNVNDPSNVKS